jgi:nucleotide-binding universal stress UspA family protein
MPFDSSLFHRQSETTLSSLYLSGVRGRLLKRNLSVRTATEEGYPAAEAIIDLARREQIDLIVMSRHGRSGLSRWVHGSVADQILRCAPCPVFLVRAGEAAC